jgi:DNA-binding NtrC family response regulator
VISATNRDLLAVAEQNAFRADLYYRLAGFPLRLPALRERADDVPALAQHVLAQASAQQGKPIAGFTPEAMECLTAYAWPGNVRELQNEVGRAVALASPGGAIELRHLGARLRGGGQAAPESPGAPARVADLREARGEFERRHILAVLEKHGGNITRAAQSLGLSRFMLQRKLKDYGLR